MQQISTPTPNTNTNTSADRWTRIALDMDAADAAQARLHALLADRYRLRADDGDDAERAMVRFATLAPAGSPLAGSVRLVHAAVLARYTDGTARVRLLEGAARSTCIVSQTSVIPLASLQQAADPLQA